MKQRQFFSIIYEDEFMTAVNKAPGLAVGGDRWDSSKERLDQLLSGQMGRVYTVHRIDQDTSGLVVFAKDRETHAWLSGAFETRQVEKRYIAVVHGRVSWSETSCDMPLVPNGDKLHRTIIDKYRGKKSLTHFRSLGGAGNYGVVEALPQTGRTHQIRVHLASLGHPVVCDSLYGPLSGDEGVYLSSFKRGWRGERLDERPLLGRLGLHAVSLSLPARRSGAGEAGLTVHAPLFRDMAALLRQIEKCGTINR